MTTARIRRFERLVLLIIKTNIRPLWRGTLYLKQIGVARYRCHLHRSLVGCARNDITIRGYRCESNIGYGASRISNKERAYHRIVVLTITPKGGHICGGNVLRLVTE